MIDARATLAAVCGGGVGALAALAAVHAAHSIAQAVSLAAAALSVGVMGFVGALWLESVRPSREGSSGARVVFTLFVAAGLLLAGGHAHG